MVTIHVVCAAADISAKCGESVITIVVLFLLFLTCHLRRWLLW